MLRRTIPLLFVFTISAFLVGHKAAAAVYSDTSVAVMPSPGSYGSSDEFVRDSIIYLYPRACVYFTTGDTIRSGENQKPGKFHLNNIIENAEKDGWYVASVQPVLSAYGALSFYFNKDTGKFSCTGKGINFENSRWLDLENLSPGPKQPTPEAVAEKTAEAYEKAKLLLGNNCIKGFKRHLDRTPKKVVTVFAYARKGTTGPYICRSAWGLAIEKTKTLAIAVCEKARAKYEGLSDTPCEVFAIGNKILWKGHTTRKFWEQPTIPASVSESDIAKYKTMDGPKFSHKAFAASEGGAYGYASSRFSISGAVVGAFSRCIKRSTSCRLYDLDGFALEGMEEKEAYVWAEKQAPAWLAEKRR